MSSESPTGAVAGGPKPTDTERLAGSPNDPSGPSKRRVNSSQSRKHAVLYFSERFGLVALLAAATLFFLVSQPAFGTTANVDAILSSQAVILILALGLIVPLLAGNFDLSVGAIASASSIVAASFMVKHGWPVIPALLLGMGFALVIGLANGCLVAYVHLDGLIATLGTSIVLEGLISWFTNDLAIPGIPTSITNLATNTVLGIPVIALIAVGVALVMMYVTTQTPVGRKLTAIGSNRDAAALVGIRVPHLELLSFVTSAGLAGAAGVLLLAQQGSGNPAVDPISLVLPALAAVYLGASAITPGQFNIPGAIIGLMLVAVLISGLTLGGANAWVQSVVNGAALIIAVGTSTALRRRRLGAA